MSSHLKTGEVGEDAVCGYLCKNGYKLVDRNYREKYGEIDIIAINTRKILCFVEVKTIRKSSFVGGDNSEEMGISPEDNLTRSKAIKLRRISEAYANSHPKLINKNKGWQIDLAAVDLFNDNSFKIRYYENI